MSLLDEYKEHCVFQNQTQTDDGRGGYKVVWTDGAEFDAAIARSTSLQTLTAEKAGVTSLYTVTVSQDVNLKFHDVIKTEKGKILRVTSDGDDYHTPPSSTLYIRQVTAEEWSLPQ